MPLEETFYVVWNPDHGLPRMKHCAYSSAEGEAKRLAADHPGASFFILRAESVARRVDPVTVTKLDDLPF